MPQCPHCRTTYEVGQRFCSHCGSFLMAPEQGDTFCPHCGVRVSPKQDFCHQCDGRLKGAATAQAALNNTTPTPAPPPAVPATPADAGAVPGAASGRTPPWAVALLVGHGLILILLAGMAVLLFSHSSLELKRPAAAAVAAAPGPPATAAPATGTSDAAELTGQLQQVLAAWREAQEQKDLVKLLSVYSLAYPGLDRRRAEALKDWEEFDYTQVAFTVSEAQATGPDQAAAKVTWDIETRDRRTQKPDRAMETYRVRFVRELGRWRIQNLTEITKEGS